MSTPDAKPKKVKTLNPKMLTIAAAILIVLALLFLATPLLGAGGNAQARGNFNRPANGQVFPGQGNATQIPGGQNGFPGLGNGSQVPGGSTYTGRQFPGRSSSLMSFAFLRGTTSIYVYVVALLVSLLAAVGMFNIKRWGQVLGIVMAVVYALLALISLLPMILFSFFGMRNPVSLIIGVVHILLAVAVIVLASLPARKAPPVIPAAPAAPAV